MSTYVCLKDHKTDEDLPEKYGWFEGKWHEYMKLDDKDIEYHDYGDSFFYDNESMRPKNVEEFRQFLLGQLLDKDRVNGMCNLLKEYENGAIWFSF